MKNLMKIFYNKLFISVLIMSLLLYYVIFYYGVCIETGDDFFISALLSGFWGFSSIKIVYMNATIGFLLKTMFSIYADINWLTILYYFFLWLSGVIIIYLALNNKNKFLSILEIFLLVIYIYPVFVLLNFTKVSAFIGATGYILMFYNLKNNPKIFSIIIASVLLLFSSLIRWEAFLLISVYPFFILLVIIFKSIKQKNSFKAIVKKYLVPFLIIMPIIFGIKIFDKCLYIFDKDFQMYSKYDKARSELLDYGIPSYDKNIDKYQKLGITVPYIISLDNWKFADEDIFNYKVFNEIKKMKDSKIINKNFIKGMIMYIYDICKNYYIILPLIILFLSIIYNKKIKCQYILLISILLFELSSFYYINRTVERVLISSSIGFYMGLILLELFDVNNELKKRKYNNLKEIILIIIIFSCFIYLKPFKLIQHNAKSYSYYLNNSKQYYKLLENSNNNYILDTFNLNIIASDFGVFVSPKKDLMKNNATLGGTIIKYPYYEKNIKKHGINNTYDSLLNKNVYYVGNYVNIVYDYLNCKYPGVEYEQVDMIKDIPVYKLSLKKENLDTM